MDKSKQEELQMAIDFVRESLGKAKLELDYSTYSIKHLDYILGDAFVKGKIKHPSGAFAQNQGLIMLGIAGYLAEVIIRHTQNSRLDIDEKDEEWYLNFKVTGENGWTIQPGQRAMKRAYQGKESELYAYTLTVIKYFNGTGSKPSDEGTYTQEVYIQDDQKNNDRKPWWKLW